MKRLVVDGCRPAATPEQLAGYAKKVGQMLDMLEGKGGCSVCGIGEHVFMCPVPDLKKAKERVEFMAEVPVPSSLHMRGTEEGGAA
jgi:hypothetical protein